MTNNYYRKSKEKLQKEARERYRNVKNEDYLSIKYFLLYLP